MVNNEVKDTLALSELGHTWIIDLDGTLVEHNGYKLGGADRFLPGAEAFLRGLDENDMIIILTSRTDEARQQTVDFLHEHGIRYDHILFNAPHGERIVINDSKPSGLRMAIGLDKKRDAPFNIEPVVNEKAATRISFE